MFKNVLISLAILVTMACGGGSSKPPAPVIPAAQQPVITAPTTATKGQSYQANTPAQAGCTFTWGINGGTITSGQTTPAITFTADVTGSLVLTCKALNSAGSASTTAQVTVRVNDPAPATWPGIFRHLKGSPAAAMQIGTTAANSTGTLSMSCKRLHHTATQIPDGRIVIIGGTATSAADPIPLAIDIFDPIAERFTTATAKLPYPRISHQAVLLDDGRIALIGGSDNIDIYDPIADTLTESVMVFEHNRQGFSAVGVGDNKILVFGGYNDSATMLPPKLIDTLTWTQVVISTETYLLRHSFAMTQLRDGRVAICSGRMGATVTSCLPVQDMIIFTPSSTSFQAVGSILEPRLGHTMLELSDGTLGIYGGLSTQHTETFNVTTSSSSYGGDLISSKSFMLSATLQNGYTLHCGGQTGNLVTNTQMVYDPITKTSGYTNSMLTTRKDFTLTVMPNGCYLVTGGQDDQGNALDGAEVFDPQASVTVTYPSATLPYTESVQLTASGDTTGLVWTCDQGSIDDATGKYTAPDLSSNFVVAYITATNDEGKSAVVHVAFTRDIIVVDGPAKVAKDSTVNTYAAVINWYGDNDKAVVWTATKGKITAGVLDVTGLAVGDTVTVTAVLSANTNYSSSTTVTVE
jgi:hypothetical protein